MSETKERLSDSTWQSLDRYAGRLSRRDRSRVLAAAVVALLVAVTVVVAWRVGYPRPRFAQDSVWANGVDPGRRTFEQDLTIVNAGPHTERIVSVGRNGPGLQLISTGVTLPITLEPGAQQEFRLSYRVTACEAAPTGRWPVPFRVERFWGTATSWQRLPAQSPSVWEDTADPSAEEVEWQAYFADWVCHPGKHPGETEEPEEGTAVAPAG